ncbi:ferrous iron transport protein B [Candidatus Woesearchaeota archaeon]|nr:ferrous iron transport protein B [Candidatus Woesearchaeota archaeon]
MKTVALVGNPNVGKSTLFNSLTGSNQHVGNWPGKTVAKIEGRYKEYTIVDLPGTYSLSAYSNEELITRNFLRESRPDIVIQVIDCTKLERNLYLTTQLMELKVNLVIALNMVTLAKKRGVLIDENKLSQLLGYPVVKIEANSSKGILKLMDVTKKIDSGVQRRNVFFGKEIEEHIEQVSTLLEKRSRWEAIKLLEDDKDVTEEIKRIDHEKKLISKSSIISDVKRIQIHLEEVFGKNIESIIADARYHYVSGLMLESVKKNKKERIMTSENVDYFLTNRFIGLPIFFATIFLVFFITFIISKPISDIIQFVFSYLSVQVLSVFGESFLSSFVVDGLIAGVGSVLVFVPPIFMLFFMISVIEDSGYMARAAFLMDRFMHKLGLHGKSFLPLILGFGCTVPAILASRILDSKKDRILTILLTPFMSCGAKLPVYVLFAAAFFPNHNYLVLFGLYIFGIIMAIIIGIILNKTLFKGLSSPFVMEMPSYRFPTLKGLIIHAWENTLAFIKKAGTVILFMVVLLWLLASLPVGVDYASKDSLIGILGQTITPFFEPLGFASWQNSVSLFFGVFAKEAIVSSLGTLYGVGEDGLINTIKLLFTSPSALSFLFFILLYSPCLASILTIKKEIGARWAIFSMLMTTSVAWLVSLAVYHVSKLLL